MDFTINDIISHQDVDEYGYPGINIKNNIPFKHSHFIIFLHKENPLHIKIEHKVRITSGTNEIAFIKTTSTIIIESKNTPLQDEETLFFMKVVFRASIDKLVKCMALDSGISLTIPLLSDHELLKLCDGNMFPLN